MKKTYLNPEAMILTVDSEDIVRTSGGILNKIEGVAEGYDDARSLGEMFNS